MRPPRGGGGDRPRRSPGRVQGSRVLVVCRGRGTVSAAALHARGRRHQRADRGAPGGDPDGRARRHDGSPSHAKTRGLLSKLITPKRSSENEEFMWRLADQQIDKFIDNGSCEFMADYAKPFVDAGDRRPARRSRWRTTPSSAQRWATRSSARSVTSDTVAHNPLVWLDDKFRGYISDRRREPREDVLTELAAATYPDGSVPEVDEVVKLVDIPVRGGHGDDDQTAQHRDAGHRRASGHPAVAARQPRADPGVPRRGAADGEPGQEPLPVGADDDDDRGSGGSGGHDHHVASRCQQP